MRKTMFIIALLTSINILAKPVGCEGAPKQASTELPAPIDQWAVVFCSPKGHMLGAIDGTIWLAPNGRPFMFEANPKPTSDDSKHSSYFSDLSHTKLEGLKRTNTNKMLAKATGEEDQSLAPWQFELKSSEGFLYSVFFYEKDKSVKYVLGCVNRCQQSVLLIPKTLDQLKRELSNLEGDK